MKRWLAILGATLILPLAVPAMAGARVAAATITPVVVLGGPASTVYPASNGTWLTYETNSSGNRLHWDVMAKNLHTGRITKINAPGTQGYSPSFDPGTNAIVYQQVTANHSDIFRFNLDGRVRTRMPSRVNTPAWEWAPSVSKRYLEFVRIIPRGTWQLMRYDRMKHVAQMLASAPGRCQCLFADGMGERWASYTQCIGHGPCQALIRSAFNPHSIKVPNPNGSDQYSPIVNETTGDAYFIRAGRACGAHVQFFKWHIGSGAPATLVATLPAGFDVDGRMSLAPTGLGGTDLLFTRFNCHTRGEDLFRLPNIVPPT